MDKKYGVIYLLFVAIFMSIVTALIIPPLNGANIELPLFGIIFGCSVVLTMIFGLVLPLPKLDAAFCKHMNQDPLTGFGKVLVILVNTAIMMVFLTLVMVAILTGGFGPNEEGVNYLTRVVGGYLNIYPIAATAMVLLDPLIIAIATKLAGAPKGNEKDL